MLGKETRELTQDMNLNKTRVQQPNTVPLSPVRSPNPSSMSQVGSELRGLASVMAGISDSIAQYYKKEEDQSYIDGQLARAQGKALAEAEKLGTRAGPGWIAADMSTQANQFYIEQSQQIRNSDYSMTPNDYRAKMNGAFQEIYSTLPNDPQLKQLALKMSEDVFSRLAAEQIAAHQTFNYEQTKVSLASNADSILESRAGDEATVELASFMDAKSFGLNPDDHYKILGDVAAYRLETKGDRRLVDMLESGDKIPVPLKQAAQPADSRLVNAIGKVESGNRSRDASGAIIQGPQIIEADGTVRTGPSGVPDRAYGKYQVMESTFKDPATRARLGLPPTGDFSNAAEVDDFGLRYMNESAAIMNGDPKLIALAHVSGWNIVDNGVLRGIPDPRTGAITPEEFVVRYGNSVIRDPVYREKITNMRLDYIQKVSAAYGEDSPSTSAQSDRNQLPMSYDTYSRLRQARIKAAKEQQSLATVETALKDNMLGVLPGKDQKAGLNLLRQASFSLAKAESPIQPGEDPAAYQERIGDSAQKLYFKALQKQPDVVDQELRGRVAASLSLANIMDPSQTSGVSEGAIQMLGTLMDLKANTSPQYLKKYLPENDAIIHHAITLAEDGGQEYAEALKTAVRAQELIDNKIVPTPPDAAEIEQHVRNTAVQFKAGWWDRIVPDIIQVSEKNPEASVLPWANLGMPRQVLERAIDSPDGKLYQAKVQALANTYSATLNLPPKAAAQKAAADIGSRTVMVAGKLFSAPAGQSAAALYGLEDTSYFEKYPGALTLAVSQYLRAVGDYSVAKDWNLSVLHTAKIMSRGIDALTKITSGEDFDRSDVTQTIDKMYDMQVEEMGAFGPTYKNAQTAHGAIPLVNTFKRVPDFDRQHIFINWDTGDIEVNIRKKDGNFALPTNMVISRDVLATILPRIPEGASNAELRELFKTTQ